MNKGEFFAIATAVCWTITSMSFEYAGKRLGIYVLNIFRLSFALISLSIIGVILYGEILPLNHPVNIWIFLSLSGFIGFFLGDLFLTNAFVRIGSRISMLIFSLSPPLTAILSWVFIKETMSIIKITGMLITLGGIVVVILNREKKTAENKKPFSLIPSIGILFAFLGALGQSAGLVLSKVSIADIEAFSATQIRIIPALTGFVVLTLIKSRYGDFRKTVLKQNKKGMLVLLCGSVFGPLLGVTASLQAIKYTNMGVASTLMSITPILIIIPSIIFFKERVKYMEVAGAFLAVGGIAMLFLSH